MRRFPRWRACQLLPAEMMRTISHLPSAAMRTHKPLVPVENGGVGAIPRSTLVAAIFAPYYQADLRGQALLSIIRRPWRI
jgi:hypothetical protein